MPRAIWNYGHAPGSTPGATPSSTPGSSGSSSTDANRNIDGTMRAPAPRPPLSARSKQDKGR